MVRIWFQHSDDVYFGARTTMGEVKVSLHASNRWRLALTEKAALRQRLGDNDRVLMRWERPAPFLPGWRRAASIFIPTPSLQPSWPEKPAKTGRIGFWPAPQGDRAFLFDLLIREVDAEGLTLNDVVGEVGRIDLPSGGGVWVIANEGPMNSEALTWITRLPRSARTRYVEEKGPESIHQLERPAGAGWGYAHDDGRPVIIDLGDLSTSAPD